MISLTVNGERKQVDVPAETPLLWVLRDTLGITSVKYGCGIGECGACTVLLDGRATRSCSIAVSAVGNSKILTIEGLPAEHPIKVAWIEKQAPQCGYCQPGMMLHAASFLTKNPTPSDAEIAAGMDAMICRCGSHHRVKQAVKMAAEMMKK